MKALKIVIAVAAVSLLSACNTAKQNDGVSKADLDQVRTLAEKAMAHSKSNTARIDRMFEKAMAK